MAEYKLGEVESIFADIIWNNEPLSSRRLAELAEERLNWKRTTTYTALRPGVISERRGRGDLSCQPAGILCPAKRAVCGQHLSGLSAGFPGGLQQPEKAVRFGN